MQQPQLRGIRGATTVSANTREAIWQATQELLIAMVEANHIDVEDIVDVIFTTSKDLNAAFPAAAARQLGWVHVPLLDVQQLDAPDLPKTLRVLIHAYTPLNQKEIQHIYLGKAKQLRPDLSQRSQPQHPMRALVSGITGWNEAVCAIEKGAHALGFILEPRSRSYINPEKAREIIQKLPPFVGTVGVFENTPRYIIQELTTFCRLDWLVFLGEESPKDCEGYFQPLIKKLSNLNNYQDYHSAAAFLVPKEEIINLASNAPYVICPGQSLWERIPGAHGLYLDIKDIM